MKTSASVPTHSIESSRNDKEISPSKFRILWTFIQLYWGGIVLSLIVLVPQLIMHTNVQWFNIEWSGLKQHFAAGCAGVALTGFSLLAFVIIGFVFMLVSDLFRGIGNAWKTAEQKAVESMREERV